MARLDNGRARRTVMFGLGGAVVVAMIFSAAGQMGAAATNIALQAPEIPASPVEISDTASLAFPLDRYLLSAADQQLLSEATIALASKCENRFGVTNTNTGLVETVPQGNPRRYGIESSLQAAQLGYHAPNIETVNQPSISKGSPQAWQPSTMEALVAYGNGAGADLLTDVNNNPLPVGGCYGEAWRELVGTDVANPALIDSLNQEASTYAEKDARVQAAWTTWSSCMSAHGFHYDSPWRANDAGWNMAQPPSAIELETASTDSRCRADSNLVAIWYAVETGYQSELIAMNKDTLAQLDSRLDAIRKRARNATTL